MTRAQKRFVAALAFALLAGGLLLLGPARGDEKKESAAPPKGAQVLFDGKDLSGWETLGGKPAEWKVEDGYMEVVPGKGDIRTKETYGPDFELHVEFWLPLMKDATGQGRANSGVFVDGRYEVQVLDSYMNDTYANGSVGALYSLIAPDKEAQQKAIKPPEQWNTYDITFRGPRTSDGKVTQPGRITVRLNDVAIIDDGKFSEVPPVPLDKKIGTPGPLRLQDHGCKVRFRNIWVKPLARLALSPGWAQYPAPGPPHGKGETAMGPSGEKEVASLESLFLDCLQGLYDAERRLLEALPRLADAAHSSSLQHAFRQHLRETHDQVARLERAFGSVGRPAQGRTSHAMKGLLDDGPAALTAGPPGPIRDAALIAAAQNVEHYEMSAYGTARAFARQLGHEEAARLLGETLFEEVGMDRWLTCLAEGSINARATSP